MADSLYFGYFNYIDYCKSLIASSNTRIMKMAVCRGDINNLRDNIYRITERGSAIKRDLPICVTAGRANMR